MFITSENYVEQVSKVVEESKSLSVAVAFWGKSSDSVFKSRKGLPTRIICNLMSGGTNPDAIRTLLAIKEGLEVRQINDLHAKVIVGEKHAIVGSANFSTNGLRLEDAQESGWKEAGILTSDAVEISSIQSWFDQLWLLSNPIEEEYLKQAEKNWPLPAPQWNPSIPLMKTPLAELKSKPIYIVVWRETASVNAESTYQKFLTNETFGVNNESFSLLPSGSFSFFEDWQSLPERDGSLINASLISVNYKKPRGKIIVEDSWKRICDVPFLDENGTEKFIQVVMREKDVLKKDFSKADQEELGRLLKPHIEKIWENGEGEGRIESFYNVRKMITEGLESRSLE